MIRMSPSGLREYFDRLPTTDLYLLNPLAELKRRGVRLPVLRNLAPNVYLIGRVGVIVRYGSKADVERLRNAGAARIVYVADDDFAAGASDPGLPERYRAKLTAFSERDWPALKDAGDIVIVPGDVLGKNYGAKAHIMVPAWNLPPATSEHFASDTIELVHLGTGSHRGDLAEIAPLLRTALDAQPRARLTLFAGDAAPDVLKRHPRIRSRPPLSWWRYKRALKRMRFHLALYPLADGAFNRARSANKLFEHAIVGAASLMSPNPALHAAAGAGLADLFVEGGTKEWAERIATLIAEPEKLRQRVDATRAHILAENPLGNAARIWKEILAAEL